MGYSVGLLPGFFKGFDSPKSTAGETQYTDCMLRPHVGKQWTGTGAGSIRRGDMNVDLLWSSARKTLVLFAARPCGLDRRVSPLQGYMSLGVWAEDLIHRGVEGNAAGA